MFDSVYILTLLGIPGFGRRSVRSIIEEATFAPTSLTGVIDAINNATEKYSRIKVPLLSTLEDSYKLACSTLEECERLKINVMGVNDEDFPIRLKDIPDPPVILFTKGNYKCLNNNLSVAVVGTREPSTYGERCGELYGSWFAEKGLVVVSGLAKGIDTTGHRGCLNVNGQTVAVLAQGLDTGIYPSENRALAQEIIESNGCLVSEYTLGVRGRPNFFVERDRLQAGLSAGVVVVETDIKGGTMHTVRFCQEQMKPLGCLNHPEKFYLNNNKAEGNRYLIEQGKALPLFSQDDIDSFIAKMESVSALEQRLIVEKSKVKTLPKNNPDSPEQLELF